MLTWEEIVQNYITRFYDQIFKVTRPLHEHFGISYFTYHEIDEHGRYTVLVDRPDWAEYYVAQKLYLSDPFLRHPSNYKSGMTRLLTFVEEDHKEKVLKAGHKFNLDPDTAILIIDKHETSVEFFGFVAPKDASNIDNIYLNNPQLFKTFATYFKEELKQLLSKMQDDAGYLKELKGADFFRQKPIHPGLSSSQLTAYLQDLKYKPIIERAAALSARERQCLTFLLKGKSAKETATLLKLSPRTIEFYFENIKNKMHCHSKHQLFTIAETLQSLNLL